MRGLLLCVFVAACHGDPSPAPAPAPSAEFTTDDASGAATVFLRGKSTPDGNQIVVDVVARGATDVHGAAFRLTFDPEVLSYVEVKRGDRFSAGSMNITREVKPGELMAAWTETGAVGFAANDDTILGTLTFDVKARGRATSMGFRSERSTLVDRNGKTAAPSLSWRGGSFSIK